MPIILISIFLGKHRRRVGSLWRARGSGAGMEEAMTTLESTAAGSREVLEAAGGRPAVEVAHLRKT